MHLLLLFAGAYEQTKLKSLFKMAASAGLKVWQGKAIVDAQDAM